MIDFIKAILILLMVLTGLHTFSQDRMNPNPASAYVHFLGYKVEIRKQPDGSEYGVCIFPDGSECDDWSFYRGICGKQYSYCALKGCDTKTRIEENGSNVIQYAVCSCKDSLNVFHDTPLIDFMEQHGDTLIKYNPNVKGAMK
jgi:putative hemolysin